MNTFISDDGTVIAYDKTGNGPAVILIDGAFCSRNLGPMSKLAPLLAEKFTVFMYDRRARGESGDTKPYTVKREIEDLNKLVEVAAGSAYLFGISSGAILAIQAVASGLNVRKLALLEPPYVDDRHGRRTGNAVEELSQLIAEGRKNDACKFYLRKVIGVPAIVPFILQLTPNWRKMKANANSLPYDAAVCGDFHLPEAQLAAVTIPVLVIDSEKSPKVLRDAVRAVAESLPNGERRSLKGTVHDIPPKILAPALIRFFTS